MKEKCINCEHFGYWNGKPLDLKGKSVCTIKKNRHTYGFQHCRHFKSRLRSDAE